jgi:hypothetical protein
MILFKIIIFKVCYFPLQLAHIKELHGEDCILFESFFIFFHCSRCGQNAWHRYLWQGVESINTNSDSYILWLLVYVKLYFELLEAKKIHSRQPRQPCRGPLAASKELMVVVQRCHLVALGTPLRHDELTICLVTPFCKPFVLGEHVLICPLGFFCRNSVCDWDLPH